MPQSVKTPAYGRLLALLIDLRRAAGVSQTELADRLGKSQPWVSYAERGVRRLDVIEFYAWVRALGADPSEVFRQLTDGLPPYVAI